MDDREITRLASEFFYEMAPRYKPQISEQSEYVCATVTDSWPACELLILDEPGWYLTDGRSQRRYWRGDRLRLAAERVRWFTRA